MENNKLFEINTRVWLKRFNTGEKTAKLPDVPESYWQKLSEKGINAVWLMGIWKTCNSLVERCCFEEGLIQSYDRALKTWRKEDVIGSPYAIDKYEINPALGTKKDLENLRKTLNKFGMKLILDFIPNHFSAESEVIKTNPEIFLNCKPEHLEQDSLTFFKSDYHSDRVFAHGRDPFFPAWTDTIQINYFNPQTREFLTSCLKKIAKMCDGVRCDMAMLVLNNVFNNTWRGVIDKEKYPRPVDEFWKEAIDNVKAENKDFIFIAEAYWNLEWDLQQLGFDYTYDKKLLDRLTDGTPVSIRDHLRAEQDYQVKSVRFIENHDEDRATAKLGVEKSFAAAIIISTVQGLKLYFDGQFVGKRIKLPVQLGVEPEEKEIKVISNFYNKLFSITNNEIFKFGSWRLIETLSAGEGNNSYENILAWHWNYNSENRLVVINYSPQTSQCRLKLDLNGYDDALEIFDVLHDKGYIRSLEEVRNPGLFVELAAYQSHIFAY
jgi:1,4-alpha-glucan branching enzyme